jgi:hypothetical protein
MATSLQVDIAARATGSLAEARTARDTENICRESEQIDPNLNLDKKPERDALVSPLQTSSCHCVVVVFYRCVTP